MIESDFTADEVSVQNNHLTEKLALRKEKKRDKENENILIVIFDLQNVVTMQKADTIGVFYASYRKRKSIMPFGLNCKLGDLVTI